MQRGKREARHSRRLAVGALLLSASLSWGCVKQGTRSLLDAATSPENQAKLDVLRERTERSVHEWAAAAVSGAMESWSNPQRQATFREQTGKLAHDLAHDAVSGLLDGATDPARAARLETQLKEALELSLATFGQQLTKSISPALDQTLDAASKTLASDLRQQLGPALGATLREQVMPALGDGLRQELGPALAEVIRRDIAGPLEKDVGPSLGAVVGKAVETPLNRVLDRLERLSDKTREDAVSASRNLVIGLGLALAACVIGGVFAWRKARAQLRAVELLTTSIKRLEGEPGVQRLLDDVHDASVGTVAGDYLHAFLASRPSLRARREGGAMHEEPIARPA
jgi:hypothetical protein